MKKQATRRIKDLQPRKNGDVKGGEAVLSSVQKKLNDTNQSTIGKI